MKVILSRVQEASVTTDKDVVGCIQYGYLVLVGLTHLDTEAVAKKMAEKIVGLRIMPDENGKMNKTLADAKGSLLVVPNFTLYADTSGRRPGFKESAHPNQAQLLFNSFVANLVDHQVPVQTGSFGDHMHVHSINDGPLTLILEIKEAV